jgi:hypothetical protein
MRDALAYLDEQKAAHQGKKSPEGINLIHKIMGIPPGDENVQDHQQAKADKKYRFQPGGILFDVLYNINNIHGLKQPPNQTDKKARKYTQP